MFLPSLNKVTCLDFTKSHVISYSKEAQFKVQFTNYQYELTKRVNEKPLLDLQFKVALLQRTFKFTL